MVEWPFDIGPEGNVTIDQGAMQALIELIEHALEDLGIVVSLNQLESVAVTIHNAMSAQTRLYHNLDHVFNFDNPEDPIVQLAAIFHDIVYYQVDKGFYPELERLIRPYLEEKNGEMFIAGHIPAEDRLVHLLLKTYGFQPGQKLLLMAGLNEFLSALVMIKMMGGIVPDKELLKASVCIEATIPFRGRDAAGRNPIQVLEVRMQELLATCYFSCTPAELETTLKRAVVFSNKDVETFAEEHVGRFLDITWKLLPESNIALRSRGIYTIRDYRLALQKMEGFLAHLNPEHVFNQYLDVPSDVEFARMRAQAHHNIVTAVQYMRLKLLTMAILEALAEYTGGDAPLSLFVGDIPKGEAKQRRLDDYLPQIELPEHIDPETDEVYHLLDIGRVSETAFDLRNSPTALYVYRSLTKAQTETIYQDSVAFFANKITPREFIDRIPQPLRSSIARGCAYMAYTRREKLMELALEA